MEKEVILGEIVQIMAIEVDKFQVIHLDGIHEVSRFLRGEVEIWAMRDFVVLMLEIRRKGEQ